MYPLPKELGLESLIGASIVQVCVGPYDAQVHFSNGTTIQAEYKLEGIYEGKRSLWFLNEWKDSSGVMKVMDGVVVAFQRVSEWEFRIELSSNIALCFHTEDSQFESINISYPNGALVVV